MTRDRKKTKSETESCEKHSFLPDPRRIITPKPQRGIRLRDDEDEGRDARCRTPVGRVRTIAAAASYGMVQELSHWWRRC
ncbi:hypothetical protein EYF80_028476 [Liparis tanakae]|uniref:Uncharacterized protein n=1 Tax=Liparis tanakae TaxID=230148 RepID=A0A4Z2H8C2_9TELE|nr:hypothetical protein EYF80_028476 [Liparis tanakae]